MYIYTRISSATIKRTGTKFMEDKETGTNENKKHERS